MSISQLWQNRILSFEEHGNNFTYEEIAEMSGVSRGNVSVVLRKMEDSNNNVITRIEAEDGGKVRFAFNYDAVRETVSEEAVADIPEWLSVDSYENIISQMGDLKGMEIKLSHMSDWIQKFQRGGITVTVYEEGQKFPEYSKVFRLDNCIVV